MATKKNAQATLDTNTGSGAMPVVITREELHRDILILFVYQARIIGWMTDEAKAYAFLSKKPPGDYEMFDPDLTPEDLGISYADIQHTTFAQTIVAMYEYAYFGLVDGSAESMSLEGIYTWTAAILDDMSNSSAMQEWGTYGPNDTESARRCRRVAEIANARFVLEGGEGIFYFHGPDGDSGDEGSLTVRQLALLSGMEEHSIRSAANPKRAKPLETYSDNGKTRISIATAKSWLTAKGRYVSITRRWSDGDIDLTKRRFSTVDELHSALEARCAFLVLNESSKDEVGNRFVQLGVSMKRFDGEGRIGLELERSHFTDFEFVARLARALVLDVELLVLRAREAIASEELAAVNSALREIQKH